MHAHLIEAYGTIKAAAMIPIRKQARATITISRMTIRAAYSD
jgi:hypothetical protein